MIQVFEAGHGNPVVINIVKQDKLKLISVTIALTRYNEYDELLRQCMESIAAQKGVRARVFVLDQNEHRQVPRNPQLLRVFLGGRRCRSASSVDPR